MDEYKIRERIRFDIKYLLWRAEVYHLGAEELEEGFRRIREEYRRLAEPGQSGLIERELADWHKVIVSVASVA